MSAGNNDEQRPVIGRPFPKGVSGNPDGRPAVAKLVRDLCRENNRGKVEDVVAELYEMALNGKGLVKLEAIKYIIDRVAGKPTVAVSDADGEPLRAGLVILPAREST